MVNHHAPVLILLLLVAFIILPVSADNVTYNTTYTLDKSGYIPWDLWVLSGLLGLALVLLSIYWSMQMSVPHNESAAIVSILAWIPIAYCMVASWQGVDRVTGYAANTMGLMINHQINVFTDIAVLMLVFLVVAILNTVRIVALHKVLKGQHEVRE